MYIQYIHHLLLIIHIDLIIMLIYREKSNFLKSLYSETVSNDVQVNFIKLLWVKLA